MCEAETTSKVIWIAKSSLASCEAKSSLISASDESCKVSGHEATSALLKAQPHFSHKAKGKVPVSAKREAALLAEATLSCKARVEELSDANSKVISLQNRALLNDAKAPSAHIVSPRSEAMASAKSGLTLAFLGLSLRLFSPSRLTFSLPESSCWIEWVKSTQTCGNF